MMRGRLPSTSSTGGVSAIACVLASAIAFSVVSSASGAQDPDPPLALQPTYHPPLTDQDATVVSVAFSPDDGTAYVHVHVLTLDLWPLLSERWPEVGGAITGLALLGTLIGIMRVRGRPQRRGVPHCRRCNYDLTAHVGVAREGRQLRLVPASPLPCPECGRTVTPRSVRIGRSHRRRLVIPLLVTLSLGTTYAAMILAGVPRDGRASRWLHLPSHRAAAFVANRSWASLVRRVRPTDRVLLFDLRAGQLRGVLCTRTSTTHARMDISPDGSSVFLWNAGRPPGIDRISTRTGRVLASAPFPGGRPVPIQNPVVVGFSPDGGTAYISGSDEAAAQTVLVGWNLVTGERVEISRTQSYLDTRGGRRSIWARQFYLRGGGTAPRFIAAPVFMEAYPSGKFDLRLYKPGEPDRVVDLSGEGVSPRSPLAVTPDGTRAFVALRYGRGILGVDLDSGERLGTLAVEHGVWDDLTISPNGRWLVVPSHGDALQLRDLQRRRWVCRLEHPARLIAPQCVVSVSERWLGAVAQVYTGVPATPPGPGGFQFTHELLIYDLAGLRPPSAP